MKKSRILTIFAVVIVLMLTFTSCELFQGFGPGVDEHEHSYVDGKCECGESDPNYKPEHTHNFVDGKCECGETIPVISVVPADLEINAGDEIDLMFGVSVTDEGDEAPRLIIADDDGFDADVEGNYTITYQAANKYGHEATATRTIKVNKALSTLTLEVRLNRLGENKWQGNLISFKNQLYVEISADTTVAVAKSGVFYNTSTSSVTLSIEGQYGVAAIIDANGVVIEGRDGANSKLVNEANPVRDSSSATTLEVDGETVTVASAFAKNMVIPAGGYAIVVQNGYCGTTVDDDGRGYMNWNVIYQIGNVVRLFWTDTEEVITEYVDQAPVISGHTTTVYAGNNSFVLEEGVLAGVTATDDNGTFETKDDVSVEVKVVDEGGFSIDVPGQYQVKLSAKDDTHTTEVVRIVEVNTSTVEIKINNNAFSVPSTLIAVDEDLTVLGKYYFLIYTPGYDKGINFSNGYGEAFVINKYGEIVRIYDGANGKYRDADNLEGITDSTKCTAAGYLKEAYASLQDGEYLLVAPNGNGNVSRKFLLDNRTIGGKVTLPDITFAAHECISACETCGGCLDEACTEAACATKCSCHKCESICEICGKCLDAECKETVCADKCAGHNHSCESVCEHCAKCTDSACTDEACANKCEGHEGHMFVTIGSKNYEAVEGKWAINETITTSTAASKAVWVFTKDYTGDFSTNGYGVAVVLDKYGRVIEVYDGANGGYWLPDGKQASAHFNVNTYATVAWSELQEGETLVVLPNGGSDGNAARQVGLDCRYLFNQKLNLTGVEFASSEMTIQIGSKVYTAVLGKWAVNETITTSTAASKAVWVFTKDYTGDFSTNGYGVAVVLDKYGRVVRVYDGANGGYWLPDGKQASAHFDVNTYATVAWSELQAGETLVVLPNGGSDGNAARQVGLDCRYLFNQKMSVTGIEFASTTMTIQIGSKVYTAELGKWAVNETITTSTAASKAIWVFTKDYTGDFSTNGYGVAVILDKAGKVVRVYDGANGGYWLPDGKQASAHFDVNTYATVAWSELQEGETLVLLPNGGSDGNAARQIGLDCRYLFNQKMSVTGFTFE